MAQIVGISPDAETQSGYPACALAPDWLLVTAYGHWLPEAWLRLPTRGALNVHAVVAQVAGRRRLRCIGW